MGLLSGLLGLPLAPIRGVTWVLEQVVREAERQHADPAPLHRELAELEADLLAGRITEEEFGLREDELLDRLEEIAGEGDAYPADLYAVAEADSGTVTEAAPDGVTEPVLDGVTEVEPDGVTEPVPDTVTEVEPEPDPEPDPGTVTEVVPPGAVTEADTATVTEAAPATPPAHAREASP